MTEQSDNAQFSDSQLRLPFAEFAFHILFNHEECETLWSRVNRICDHYALGHREEALEYALQFSPGLDAPTADRFVAMYVNERTLDYGAEGRRAVQTLLDRGFEKGLIPHRVEAEFVD